MKFFFGKRNFLFMKDVDLVRNVFVICIVLLNIAKARCNTNNQQVIFFTMSRKIPSVLNDNWFFSLGHPEVWFFSSSSSSSSFLHVLFHVTIRIDSFWVYSKNGKSKILIFRTTYVNNNQEYHFCFVKMFHNQETDFVHLYRLRRYEWDIGIAHSLCKKCYVV